MQLGLVADGTVEDGLDRLDVVLHVERVQDGASSPARRCGSRIACLTPPTTLANPRGWRGEPSSPAPGDAASVTQAG